MPTSSIQSQCILESRVCASSPSFLHAGFHSPENWMGSFPCFLAPVEWCLQVLLGMDLGLGRGYCSHMTTRVGLWEFRPTQCPTSMVPCFALDSSHITFCVLTTGEKEICLIHHCHQLMRIPPGTEFSVLDLKRKENNDVNP